MSKIILTLAIILILAGIVWGGWYIISNLNNGGISPAGQNQGQTNSNNFTVQGMKVEILKQGTGDGVKKEQSATVHYRGTLQDGKEFDSSIKRNSPFTFKVGSGLVIKGWDLGVEGMKVGEKRKLTIPPDLAYGADGFPGIIPPSSTLIFEIELLSVK
ncbi:MAG: FKBP-type peptidyl-prolyl cis-trans isomerase [Patescibacteria group bacterium]